MLRIKLIIKLKLGQLQPFFPKDSLVLFQRIKFSPLSDAGCYALLGFTIIKIMRVSKRQVWSQPDQSESLLSFLCDLGQVTLSLPQFLLYKVGVIIIASVP